MNFVVAGGNKLIADAAIAFKLVNVELENDVRWLLKRPESKWAVHVRVIESIELIHFTILVFLLVKILQQKKPSYLILFPI